ncbi:MAG: phosphoadenylyl-sulfate reductase [Ignavibacteriaceae bacterium]
MLKQFHGEKIMNEIYELNLRFEDKSAEEILRFFLSKYGNKIALASSLSIEDQVLIDIILKIDKNARIFTLDTGRLPYETYKLIDETNTYYNYKLDILYPQNSPVEKMVKEKGINLFYNSVEERKLCCYNRKVEPLKRALNGLDAWICGLRKEQSVTRENLEIIEFDEGNRMMRINPILNWTEIEVLKYIKENNVPYNKLYDQNFKSIGCAPCTRPVREGEDLRSGRWWWENPDTKECGLHINHSNNKA